MRIGRYGLEGEERCGGDCQGQVDEAWQARCVKVARRKVVQGELTSGRHGEFGRVMVGFGKSRIGSIR